MLATLERATEEALAHVRALKHLESMGIRRLHIEGDQVVGMDNYAPVAQYSADRSHPNYADQMLLLLPTEERGLYHETMRWYDWEHLTAIARTLQQTTPRPLDTAHLAEDRYATVLADVTRAEISALATGLNEVAPLAGVHMDTSGQVTPICDDPSTFEAIEQIAAECDWPLLLEHAGNAAITVTAAADGVTVTEFPA